MASKNLMQMSIDIVKLDRFDGESFKRWQKKMQFLLATLNVAYVLTKPYPEESEDETLGACRDRLKFENDDFICRGHILNATFTLIMDQMYELEDILSMFTQNNMNMDESIQVASIIDKLPSTWKDVKKSLKRRKDDLSLKDLGKHLLIEEQYRLENKANDDTSKVHGVEEKGESSKTDGKKRHFKKECRALKKKQDGGNDNKNKYNNFVVMISEAFSLEEEISSWVDSGDPTHVQRRGHVQNI
ncbi:hypothetical protein Tco_1088138 [Tanacetum coccineum]